MATIIRSTSSPSDIGSHKSSRSRSRGRSRSRSRNSFTHELLEDDVDSIKSFMESIGKKRRKKKLFSTSKASSSSGKNSMLSVLSLQSVDSDDDNKQSLFSSMSLRSAETNDDFYDNAKNVEEQRTDDNTCRSDIESNTREPQSHNNMTPKLTAETKTQQRQESVTVENNTVAVSAADKKNSTKKNEKDNNSGHSRSSSKPKSSKSSRKKEKEKKAEMKTSMEPSTIQLDDKQQEITEEKEMEPAPISTPTPTPTPTTTLMSTEQEKQYLADDETLLYIKVKSRAEDSSFYLPVSLMMERELEMKRAAKDFNIDPEKWTGSKLANMYVESQNVQTQAYNGTVVTGKQVNLELDPEVECSDSNHCHSMEWKPWLTECLKMYYNNGTIRIPADCTGSDILVALEYFGIVYAPDQLVFDSFAAYLRVKLWSDYFTCRSHMADWITQRLMKLPSRHSHAFCTSSDPNEENAYLGPKRAEIFDPDLVLDPEKYDQIESRTVVHDFFCDDEGDDIDSLFREDFRTYVLNQLPGTTVTFDMKKVTLSCSNDKKIESTRAVLHISFRSAMNPVPPPPTTTTTATATIGACSSSVQSTTCGIADSTASTHKAGNLQKVPSGTLNYPSSISVFSEGNLSGLLQSESTDSADLELLEVASTSVSSIAGKRGLNKKRQTPNSKRRPRSLSIASGRNRLPPLFPGRRKNRRKSIGEDEAIDDTSSKSVSKSVSKSDEASIGSADRSKDAPPIDYPRPVATEMQEAVIENTVQVASSSTSGAEETKILQKEYSDLQIDPSVPLPVLSAEGDLRSTVSGISAGDESYTKEVAMRQAQAIMMARNHVHSLLGTAAPEIPLPSDNKSSEGLVTPVDAYSTGNDGGGSVVMEDALRRGALQAQQEQGNDIVTAFKNFTSSLWVTSPTEKSTAEKSTEKPQTLTDSDSATGASSSKHLDVASQGDTFESTLNETDVPVLLNEDHPTTITADSSSKKNDDYTVGIESVLTAETTSPGTSKGFFDWATCAMDGPEQTLSDDAAGWMRSTLFPFAQNPCSANEQDSDTTMNIEQSSTADSLGQSKDETTDGEQSDTDYVGQAGCNTMLHKPKQKRRFRSPLRIREKKWKKLKKERKRLEKEQEKERRVESKKAMGGDVEVLLPTSRAGRKAHNEMLLNDAGAKKAIDSKRRQQKKPSSRTDGNISSPSRNRVSSPPRSRVSSPLRRRLPDQLPMSSSLESNLSDKTSFDSFEGSLDFSVNKPAKRKQNRGSSVQGDKAQSKAVAFSTGTKRPAPLLASSMRPPMRPPPLQQPPQIIQKKKIHQAGTVNIMGPSRKESASVPRQRGTRLKGMFGRNNNKMVEI